LLITGVFMIVISSGLSKRKRRAWQISLVVIAASIVVGKEESIFAGLLLLLLILFRNEFYAESDPTTRWRALGLFLQLFGISLAFGLILFAERSRFMVGIPSAGDIGLTVLRGLIGLSGPVLFYGARTQDVVLLLLEARGTITVLIPSLAFLRSPSARLARPQADITALRNLVVRANDSFAYFALRDDKSIVWSQNKQVAIAYRVVAGAMLASGDPLGPKELWPTAMREFKEIADRHAWLIGVMGCSETASDMWVETCDLLSIEMGDEAIIDVASFSLEGRTMRNIRQMVARAKRNSYEVEITPLSKLSDAQLQAWRHLAAEWRGKERERGFSMSLGRYGERRDADALLVEAKKNGVTQGFLQLLPWGSDRYSLDVMRRSPHADPGINELMIVEFTEWAADNHIAQLSLNFAAFRSIFEQGEEREASPLLRITRRILLIASKWIQIESLYRFNSKFQPNWETRYLVFPKGGSIVRIGVAALEAEAFVVWPRLTAPWRWRRLSER
jgi:lysyl-tRNA synthetase class 2